MRIQFPALLHKRSSFTFLCLLFLLCVSTHPAIGQQAQTQTSAPSEASPLTLPQLYSAFLGYQNFLDTLAATRDAQGKDGSWIRNDLQEKLGFSDADYAPIRTSSQRLASEMRILSSKEKAIKGSGPDAPAQGKVQALTAISATRQTDVDNEIYNLSLELSPQNKAALETFMEKFFSPKKVTFRAPQKAGSPAGTAVQK